MLLLFGSITIWGNIAIYLVSWIRQNGSSLKVSDSVIFVPISALLVFSCTAVSIQAANLIGYRTLAFGGAILYGIFTFASSFFPSFTALIVLYGIFPAIGAGLNNMPPLKIGWDLFPNSKGKVSGFVSAGFGLAPFIFDFVATLIVNPDNLSPDIIVDEGGGVITKYYSATVANRVPLMLQVLAVIYLFVGLTGAALLTWGHKTHKGEQSITEETNENETALAVAEKNGISEKMTMGAALRGKRFWTLFTFSVTTLMYSNFTLIYFKQLGMIGIDDDIYLTTVGSIQSLINCISTPVWGLLYDAQKYKRTGYIMIVIGMIASGGVGFTVNSKFWYMLWNILAALLMSGSSTVVATEVAQIYPDDIGAELSSLIICGNLVSLVAIAVFAALLEQAIGLIYLEQIFFGLTAFGFVVHYYYDRVYT